jgi:hypothetical protein
MGHPAMLENSFGFLSPVEAISNPPEADWFKIAAGPHFHAKPDDATILNIRGTPFEIAFNTTK